MDSLVALAHQGLLEILETTDFSDQLDLRDHKVQQDSLVFLVTKVPPGLLVRLVLQEHLFSAKKEKQDQWVQLANQDLKVLPVHRV